MEKIKYATNNEIENISIVPDEYNSGIIFIQNGKERILNNNYHTLVVSEDDIQKENKVILPLINQISRTGQSFIINEKSGIIYNKFHTSLKEKGYEVICLNLDNPVNSDSFSILELSYNLYKEGNIDKALEILENVGHSLMYEMQEKSVDPFWVNSATNLFVGCTLYMFENEKEISLKKILELTDKLRKEDIKEGTLIYTYLSGILLAPNDTKGSILSVFKQKFNKYVSKEKLSSVLSTSNFDLKRITKGKMAVFIIEGTSEVSSNIVSLVTNQIYHICNIYGNDNKINIILDNFDTVAPIKNIESIISLCTSLNITIISFIKNFRSLNNVYGIETGESLKLYFKNLMYLYSSDAATLEYISKLCGTLEYIGNLRNIKENEALLIIIRMNPFMVNI